MASAVLRMALVACAVLVGTAVIQPIRGRAQTVAAPSAPIALDTSNLPDLQTFLGEIRARLASDELLQLQYTFRETVTRRDLDRQGRVKTTSVKVFEVFPAKDVGYRRLIVEDGRPVRPDALAKADDRQRRKVEEYLRDRSRDTPRDKARQAEAEARQRRDDEREVAELFRVMDARLLGRDVVEGRPTLVLGIAARPGVRPATTGGRVFRALEGQAWFDEPTRELVRADLHFVDDVGFGLGLLARVHKGTRAVLERRQLGENVWLPVRYQMRGSARVMVFKGLRLDTEVVFSDYRRAIGATSETFALPGKPR